MKLKTKSHLLFLLISLPGFLSCKAKEVQPEDQGFIVTEKDGIARYQSLKYGYSLEFATSTWKTDGAWDGGISLKGIGTDFYSGELSVFFGPSKWRLVKVDDITVPLGAGPTASFHRVKEDAKKEKTIKITQSTFTVNNITLSSIIEESDLLPGINIRDVEYEESGSPCSNDSYFYAKKPVPVYIHHDHYTSGCFLAYGKESSDYKELLKTREEVFKVIRTLKFVGTLPQAGK